jgi:hypothetical protein
MSGMCDVMASRLGRTIVLTGLVALSLVVGGAAIASAQDQPTEFDSWRLPGWTFTPGLVFGAVYDSNVAVSFPRADTGTVASDKLFETEPFGQLEFYGPRTSFSTGYRGLVRRYFDLGELNGFEPSAFFTLRERLTRRIDLYAKDTYVRVPTTDQLQLNGVPFQRTGARYDSFEGGLEARLSRATSMAVRYELTWVDFVRKSTLLTGGAVNGVGAEISRLFTDRSSLGAEYDVRWADLNQGTRQLTFQDVGAVYRYRTGSRTSLEAASGLAHLLDRNRDVTRTGPYVRLGWNYHSERTIVNLAYSRSYVPSLAFGGTNQSQELRGMLHMPVTRNRLYLQEAAALRRTDPFATFGGLPLDSIWVHTVAGYALERWLRIEGYHTFTRQDTRQAAGQIHRHLVGVQVVVGQPMRIR